MGDDTAAVNAGTLPVILCAHLPPGVILIVPADYACEACLDDVVTEAWAITHGP